MSDVPKDVADELGRWFSMNDIPSTPSLPDNAFIDHHGTSLWPSTSQSCMSHSGYDVVNYPPTASRDLQSASDMHSIPSLLSNTPGFYSPAQAMRDNHVPRSFALYTGTQLPLDRSSVQHFNQAPYLSYPQLRHASPASSSPDPSSPTNSLAFLTGPYSTCTIRSSQGPHAGLECGALLLMDRSSLEAHLRIAHGVTMFKVLRARRASDSFISCPDAQCFCRFRGKNCSRWNADGSRALHRTHVVDLLRHYKDVHLKAVSGDVPEQNRCDLCDAAFTRPENVARHKRSNCRMARLPSTAVW